MDVLVIDDEPISRIAVAQTLESAGYHVAFAANGQDALTLLASNSFQLVVCDWGLPGINGLELCRTIRATHLGYYVYIVMLTSHNHPDATLEGLRAGADDFVTKPFNPAELILRINVGRRIVEQESRDITIFALAKLAESRDQETGAHLERVRAYSRVMAQRLQERGQFKDIIDDDYVQLVYETSPLHDIGKVAIPDSILLKPGRLTSAEFEVMKTHTLRGAETLEAAAAQFPNAKFLRMAYDIALHHHEKYDGSGYPHGLSGDEIPLSGRIVALADVYDALTSKRVYKDAFPHESAREILLQDSGTHFDPAIVEAFLETEDQFIRIGSRYRDTPPCASSEAGENSGAKAAAGASTVEVG